MEDNRKKEIVFLLSRALLSIVLLLLGTLYLNEGNFPFYVNLIVMLASYLIIAYDVIIKAFKEIVFEHNPFNECTLMVVASIGAFALRCFGPDYNEYLEGVLVILLYQVGEFFEDLAEDKSKRAITKAIDLREEKAKVRVDGKIVEKDAVDILPGDLVLIGAGDKVLCDGIIVKGEGEVDESSLTGEFVPVAKSARDSVSSGTLLAKGSLEVEASKAYADSTVAKLLDLVENSAEKKSKVTRFISKFAKYYTPIVMGVAILVMAIPPLFIGIGDGATWVAWIRTALSFLVVSCPCAVVISVPLAYFSGLGLASKSGILVKGAAYFDQLNELKTMAFDKTGTLTEGKFEVLEVHPEGISQEQFFEYAAAAETISNHPVASCLKSLCSIDQSLVSGMEDIAGQGVKAIYKGHALFCGKTGSTAHISAQGTVVGLTVDGKDAGYCVLGDRIKPNSPSTIKGLNSQGIKTVLLSGDKQANAKAIGEQLGFLEIQGELKPEEKVASLDRLIKNGNGRVGYVGDGINDAASIAISDVGIAMGGLGSDAAVANADCVILNDDPKKILTLLKVAKRTKNRAGFNIAFSIVVKIAVMIVSIVASATALFTLPLWVAVLADSGLALLMILSSLLLGLGRAN